MPTEPDRTDRPQNVTRLPGLNVKPGSVRTARDGAGLSLRELAAGRISQTALHLIETGRTRPTLPTLQLIAERTGKSVDYFLEPGQEALVGRPLASQELDFTEVELALEQGRFEDAASMGERLVARAAAGAFRARALLYTGQAYVRLARVEKAQPLIGEALAFYRESDDRVMLAECLDWQAAVEHLNESPGALATAQEALSICQGLEAVPVRTVVRILGRVGAISVAQHRWPAAIEAYESAVAVGGALQDLSRMGKMYNDLSIAYRRLDKLDEAHRYAHRAVHVHEMLNDRLSVGRAQTNLALVLMRLRQLPSAEAHLERALATFRQENVERGRSHIHLALAAVQMERKELESARRHAETGRQLAQRLDERGSVAEADEILGRVAAMTGDWQESDRRFRGALAMLSGLQMPERLMSCHASYASTLEARGDTAGAVEHWKQAVGVVHPELIGHAEASADVVPMAPQRRHRRHAS
jgi:tetratricopeptide (TPR) repeat protein